MIGFLAALLLVTALVIAPARRSGPTVVRDLDGKQTQFEGLRSSLQGELKLKVLLVHGMGNGVRPDPPRLNCNSNQVPADRYGKCFMDEIANRLGLPHETWLGDEPIDSPSLPSGAPRARLTRWMYTDGSRALEVYQVQWSPLINTIKSRHLLEHELKPAVNRVPINRGLKQTLMNERFSDPVMYLGSRMGQEIRWAIQAGACSALNSALRTEGLSTKPACVGDGLRPNERLAMITWSLGSKATFDALAELRESPRGDITVAGIDRLTHIYMLANQLPLLTLAELSPSAQRNVDGSNSDLRATSLGRMLRGRSERRLISAETPNLRIVAISDPNDLLSYEIPPTFKALEGEGQRFINVVTPVGRKHVAGKGVDPLGAHTGHDKSAHVMRMLVDGSP